MFNMGAGNIRTNSNLNDPYNKLTYLHTAYGYAVLHNDITAFHI